MGSPSHPSCVLCASVSSSGHRGRQHLLRGTRLTPSSEGRSSGREASGARQRGVLVTGRAWGRGQRGCGGSWGSYGVPGGEGGTWGGGQVGRARTSGPGGLTKHRRFLPGSILRAHRGGERLQHKVPEVQPLGPAHQLPSDVPFETTGNCDLVLGAGWVRRVWDPTPPVRMRSPRLPSSSHGPLGECSP